MPCVHLLASRRNGTLHAGVTSNLVQRIGQHRNGPVAGFSQRCGAHDLVWYDLHHTVEGAMAREKAIKAWRRARNIDLIEQPYPYWRDLYRDIL